MTLEQWTEQVDNIVADQYGVGIFDILGDFMSYDMWDSGMTPEEAVEDLMPDIEIAVSTMEEVANMMGL